MRSFGTILAGVLLLTALIVSVWVYQRSSQNQGANRMDKEPESETELLSNDENSVATTSNAWTLQTTVGKIVADRPETSRILELVGIDYCCGGQKPLEEAAAAQNVDPSQLLSALMVVGKSTAGEDDRDWQQADLGALIDHIVSTHHARLRQELPLLIETTETVLRVHGDSHSELADIAATLERIGKDVFPHLDKEEQQLFPALRELANGKVSPGVEEQLASMRADHDALGDDLHRLRKLTNGYAVPLDACAKYREMLSGLTALERDLHQHVHLENNVLLLKAQDLVASIKDN